MSDVRIEVDDGVAVVTLDRPQVRNALNPSLRDGLIAAVRQCRDDDKVRALMLTGAGGAFCAGADLAGSSLGKVSEPDFDPRSMSEALHSGMNTLVTELWQLDKPTVACVDGAAVGPGAHIALACDFVMVSPATKFLWSFAKIGLVVDAGGAYLLPRLVGLPRAKAMVMLGEGSVGEQAVTDGLAYRCVPQESLYDESIALARRLAAGPTRALGMSKRLLNESFDTPLSVSLQMEAAAQALASVTDDVKEGLAAIREKRDPEFRGK
ncbi:MAG: 2-(1,2-epoxy,2-dihydrophenyl)acetyl-CoA isomerase [Frankiales bacterium]|jgi:2-(1,2-epoxy-1,2-dihydrophenyl)acetyl-CoA isomerase|nr:2-(1,2-epoxy,2-dihydrophenyl)acetyl-CoA isomerase [Frankiales bacterium]